MEIGKFTAANSSNAYLVQKDGHAVVIDAGGGAREFLGRMAENDVAVDAVFLTHTHFDHIEDIQLYMLEGIDVYVHEAESEWLNDAELNLSGMFGVGFVAGATTDKLLNGGETLRFGELEIEAIHTPGHSPGGLCYMVGDSLFTGDALFKESIGRYDFPGSDGVKLFASIKEKLLVLPDETDVFPGHGESTTVGWEKRHNPFL